MTILDLINKSAVMLNIQEVLNENLNSITADNEAEVLANNFALKRLYEFSKIVLNEISSHLPKVEQYVCEAKGNKIELSTLTRLGKVVGVKNNTGYVDFNISGGAINVKEDGIYLVVFNQYPKTDSVLDEIEQCNQLITDDILVNGLNSYYCLATGLFNEFNIYHSHYAEKLAGFKKLKVFSMPNRSWEWLILKPKPKQAKL